jgi:hypothetical protein
MATITIVPVEEYLRTTYEPDMEYVDGQLVERHVGEWSHSLLQTALAALLRGRAQGRFLTFTEQRRVCLLYDDGPTPRRIEPLLIFTDVEGPVGIEVAAQA